MHVLSIGFFAPDYVIALANALGKTERVTLFLARQRLACYFPESTNLEAELRTKHALDPAVKLSLIDYPRGQVLRKVRVTYELVRKVRALHPDVIHYQSGSSAWIPFALPFLRGFPIVATIHDASPHSGDWLQSIVVRLGNSLVTRSANHVIVHGRQQANELKQAYHVEPHRIHVIPLNSQDMYKTDAPEHVAVETHNVLFFGRLRAYKGLEVLIRAAPLIAASVSDVRIVICGSGDYPVVREAAAANPAWFEIHNRFIPADEVPSFFQRAALVVLPYLDATQTGVIPIAYRFSRPVVASRVGSIPEVVDDGITGVLVTPGDERSLADAVIRLLQDDTLRGEMGRAARAKLDRDLSWEVIASKSIEVYEQALEFRNTAALPSKPNTRPPMLAGLAHALAATTGKWRNRDRDQS